MGKTGVSACSPAVRFGSRLINFGPLANLVCEGLHRVASRTIKKHSAEILAIDGGL